MKADLSRDSFNPTKHFLRVIQQQGRVQVDADWNEQASILIHYLQALTSDVIGPYGGPAAAAGFKIALVDNDFFISPGRYYVDGILCELEPGPPITNEETTRKLDAEGMSPNSISYFAQPDWPVDRKQGALPERQEFLVYLDVWERHLTCIDDESIREIALGGPDTSTRSKIVWQVRIAQAEDGAIGDCSDVRQAWATWEERFQPRERGRLAARDNPSRADNDPCITPPLEGYRGAENQLYRVEIRDPGRCSIDRVKAGAMITEGRARSTGAIAVRGDSDDDVEQIATFVWSRENGSILSAWDKSTNRLTLADPGRDVKLGFAAGDWIELTDDARELSGTTGTLVKLSKVEDGVLTIDEASADGPTDSQSFSANPKIRRWDSDGKLDVRIPATNDGWIHLEDGVEIKFSADDGYYRTGDYWMIPARILGGVQWPADDDGNEALQPPRGINHHYAALAIVQAQANEGYGAVDCRCIFDPIGCDGAE